MRKYITLFCAALLFLCACADKQVATKSVPDKYSQYLDAYLEFDYVQTPQDIKNNMNALTAAAEDGFTLAIGKMANVYAYGLNNNEVSIETACLWDKKNAFENTLFCRYDNIQWKRGLKARFDDISKAAEAGDKDAKYALAFEYYLIGAYPVKKDISKALDALKELSSGGYGKASLHLALIYENYPAFKNCGLIVEMYNKAHLQGVPSAACHLGRLYEDGNCVEFDINKALEWFQKGADAGEPMCFGYLSDMYLNKNYPVYNRKLGNKYKELYHSEQ
ncbi:Sel1 domain protein repeat-containing protein [Elusimicrobium minutum Pei191]|uniref:Sel1 domain protein repeat-containing protein n=1 Tax=Elusimicrobium minutum (strain Pei191) TaxID=445932 RepID=B2KC82_ELUMP|nr:tetratricopeptide repeat protein [Elusimicrobium minutum]ACC98209.1 Sel1 domain protein repeat-containing protein [Elusimicrobium minutum Pei191]